DARHRALLAEGVTSTPMRTPDERRGSRPVRAREAAQHRPAAACTATAIDCEICALGARSDTRARRNHNHRDPLQRDERSAQPDQPVTIPHVPRYCGADSEWTAPT